MTNSNSDLTKELAQMQGACQATREAFVGRFDLLHELVAEGLEGQRKAMSELWDVTRQQGENIASLATVIETNGKVQNGQRWKLSRREKAVGGSGVVLFMGVIVGLLELLQKL